MAKSSIAIVTPMPRSSPSTSSIGSPATRIDLVISSVSRSGVIPVTAKQARTSATKTLVVELDG